MGNVRYSVFLKCYVLVCQGKGLAVLPGAEVLMGGRGQVSLAHPASFCEVYVYVHGSEDGKSGEIFLYALFHGCIIQNG